jgi:hypothetical protein
MTASATYKIWLGPPFAWRMFCVPRMLAYRAHSFCLPTHSHLALHGFTVHLTLSIRRGGLLGLCRTDFLAGRRRLHCWVRQISSIHYHDSLDTFANANTLAMCILSLGNQHVSPLYHCMYRTFSCHSFAILPCGITLAIIRGVVRVRLHPLVRLPSIHFILICPFR